jgi:Recombinase
MASSAQPRSALSVGIVVMVSPVLGSTSDAPGSAIGIEPAAQEPGTRGITSQVMIGTVTAVVMASLETRVSSSSRGSRRMTTRVIKGKMMIQVSRAIRASKRQAAEEGRPPSVKAYGLTPQWDGIVESEAGVLREAARRVIGGERLASLARELRSRDVPSPTGRRWTDATLGRLLRNPRIVGDRVYKGQVARDCWPAILDRETFARLQVTLHFTPSARGTASTSQAAGHRVRPMWSVWPEHGDDHPYGERYYSCPTQPTGCGRIHVRADRLEAWLLDRLLEQLRLEPPPTPQDADPGETATAMAELCRDYYVDRIVSRAAYLSARALLVRRADELSRQTGRRPEVARLLAAANPRKQLAELELAQLRDLLADRLDRLVVRPVIKPGLRVFDARRLHCEWRTPA